MVRGLCYLFDQVHPFFYNEIFRGPLNGGFNIQLLMRWENNELADLFGNSLIRIDSKRYDFTAVKLGAFTLKVQVDTIA